MIKPEDIILETHQQNHVYLVKDRFFPGVTQIIDIGAPKHPSLLSFFKNNSKNRVEKIRSETAQFGTNCHRAIEKVINKEKLDSYTAAETATIKQFLTWLRLTSPKNMLSELFVAYEDSEIRFAGTLDFVGDFDTRVLKELGILDQSVPDTTWKMVIDFKTSKNIYHTHKIQLRAYEQAVMQTFGWQIDAVAVVRFDATNFEMEVIPENVSFDHFRAVYKLFTLMIGGEVPDDYQQFLDLKYQAGIS